MPKTITDSGVSPDARRLPLPAPDAGHDAGMGKKIGERCDVNTPCAEGRCVDEVCCKTPCDGPCQRCDILPGECAPVPNGDDPDDDCDADFDCSALTFGLDATTCLPCAAQPARGGVCDGFGACRPVGCTCDQPGPAAPEARCASALCLRNTVCIRGSLYARWDTREDLCAIGETCGAMVAGCCSSNGACCPAPMCDGNDRLCR